MVVPVYLDGIQEHVSGAVLLCGDGSYLRDAADRSGSDYSDISGVHDKAVPAFEAGG